MPRNLFFFSMPIPSNADMATVFATALDKHNPQSLLSSLIKSRFNTKIIYNIVIVTN